MANSCSRLSSLRGVCNPPPASTPQPPLLLAPGGLRLLVLDPPTPFVYLPLWVCVWGGGGVCLCVHAPSSVCVSSPSWLPLTLPPRPLPLPSSLSPLPSFCPCLSLPLCARPVRFSLPSVPLCLPVCVCLPPVTSLCPRLPAPIPPLTLDVSKSWLPLPQCPHLFIEHSVPITPASHGIIPT